MSWKGHLLLLVSVLSACATSRTKLPSLDQVTSDYCRNKYESAQNLPADQQLNRVSNLFNNACYHEVIELGSYVRQASRDKFYDVTAEMAEVLTPEGTFTNYVLESYERAYLSILVAMSYLNLHQTDDALVELRRSQIESQAFIYNYGEDPVLNLLQAALWDRFDAQISRPYWKSVRDDDHEDPSLRWLARTRVQEIDTDPAKKIFWKIYGIGQLPSLEWKSDFLRGGAYKIYAHPAEFPATCASEKSILVPTSSWTSKIASRYNKQYHPLLLAKSFARLPVGISYGILGVTGGVATGAGGCVLSAYANHVDNGRICAASLQAGGYMIEKSTDLVSYTLKPDLRHWEDVPKAFYLSSGSETPGKTACLAGQDLSSMTSISLIE